MFDTALKFCMRNGIWNCTQNACRSAIQQTPTRARSHHDLFYQLATRAKNRCVTHGPRASNVQGSNWIIISWIVRSQTASMQGSIETSVVFRTPSVAHFQHWHCFMLPSATPAIATFTNNASPPQPPPWLHPRPPGNIGHHRRHRVSRSRRHQGLRIAGVADKTASPQLLLPPLLRNAW